MTHYVYRIETRDYPYASWRLAEGNARGTDEFDGEPDLVASDALRNYTDSLMAEGKTGDFRALAWRGHHEGDSEAADGIAATLITARNLPRSAGRPEVGKPVHVRLGDLLPRVDEWAKENNASSRAEAVRQLVTKGLES